MTYAQFLAGFLGIPIILLGLVWKHRILVRHRWACLMICCLAYLYTSPWDNHAAAVHLWAFDPHFAPRSHFLLFLPWEEYAFYGLQGIVLCLLCVGLARRLPPDGGGEL